MSRTPVNNPHVGFLVMEMENGYTPNEDVVQEKFAWLSSALEGFSGWGRTFYTCLESPNKVFQIGGWDSVEQHYIEFHGSQLVREALDEFGDVLDVKASWHSDMSFKNIPRNSPYLTMARLWVPKTKKGDFESNLRMWLPSMTSKCSSKLSYGWRFAGGWLDQSYANDIPKYDPSRVVSAGFDVEDMEEWNIILPFDNEADWRADFNLLKQTSALSKMLEHVERFDVKHLEPMVLQVDA